MVINATFWQEPDSNRQTTWVLGQTVLQNELIWQEIARKMARRGQVDAIQGIR